MGRVQGNTSRNCSISELRSTLVVTRLNDLLLHIYYNFHPIIKTS
ncbi:MAG: hypothetical protein ACTS6H_00550 [Candidatus Hodgkinia cicadicola]